MEYVFLIVILLTSCHFSSAKGDYERLRRALENFTAYSYDEIHRLVVLDQIESYVKPVKSVETRNHYSPNGLYGFCFDPTAEGFTKKWYNKPLTETCSPGNYHLMPVPSAFNDILSNKTAKNYVGWMWYQSDIFGAPLSDRVSLKSNLEMNFNVQNLPKVNWILQIDSINYMSIIWIQIINHDGSTKSHLVGAHVGGHLPITLDVSSIIDPRLSLVGTLHLRLIIAVSNQLTPNTIPSGQMVNMTKFVGKPFFKFQPDFDFFNFAGIMGDVRLFKLPEYFIEDVELLPNDNQDSSNDVRLCLNAAPSSTDTQFTMMISDDMRRNVRIWPQRSPKGRDSCFKDNPNECNQLDKCQIMRIHDLSLDDSGWPAGLALRHPKVRFEHYMGPDKGNLSENGIVRSAYETERDAFEMRLYRRKPSNVVEWLAARVNSTTAQLQGFGMHHEQLFSGRTMSLSSIMKDLYLVKQTGANVIRTSHYPYSPHFLDACDQLGLMVIAECPAVGLNSFGASKLALHKQILLEMMQRDHGHPSIIMWSLANEPQSQLPEARAYFESLVAYTRNDLSRFTIKAGRNLTAAIAQSHRDDKIGDLLDVLMINRYYGWYDCTGSLECVRPSLVGSLTGWAEKYGRSKPLLVSEFGADTVAGLHSQTSEIFSEEFQRDLLIEYERTFDELAANRSNKDLEAGAGVNFLGAMIWNFADFATHESLLRVGGNRKGLYTMTREPKLAVSAVKQIFHSRPPVLMG